MQTNQNFETAIFAGGCFWCTEAVFLALEGVQNVQSGYIGGHTPNPNYKEICTGTTGHAEAIAITFDSEKITFITLVELFFATHDPTTLNRQGNDVGTQYRSEIFYKNQEQKEISLQYISFLDDQNVFGNRIVTQVSPASQFFPAEEYHSNYYNRNKGQSYCSYVITPKMDKLKKVYAEKLKK
jgi:peptide-methionine (S)-S-oxide reductase